jgi:hypothetical protein
MPDGDRYLRGWEVPASTALRLAFACIQEQNVLKYGSLLLLASRILSMYLPEETFTPAAEECLTVGASPLCWAVRVKRAAEAKQGEHCKEMADKVPLLYIRTPILARPCCCAVRCCSYTSGLPY